MKPFPSLSPGAITLTRTGRLYRLESTSEVFNTVELLENIISHVPVKDLLLRVQRTCKHMRTIIATSTSPPLQQALYRQPRFGKEFTPFPIKVRGLPIHDGPWMIHVDVDDIPRSAFTSKNLRSTQLGQPPVKRLSFLPPEGDPPRGDGVEVNYSVSDAFDECEIEDRKGVTFGYLLDVIERSAKPMKGRSVYFWSVLRFHWVLKEDESGGGTPKR